MVEVSIQHLIGTVALIGLLTSAGLFYSIFTSFVQDDNRKKDLQQISENVALNIEEMINLIKFSKDSAVNSPYMIKTIELPTDVGGSAYKIQLVNDTGSIFVRTFLANKQAVSATSAIPYNSGDIPLKFNTSDTTYSFNVGADNLNIVSSGTIYGNTGVVIWANPNWDLGVLPSLITIGIGWAKGQQ